MCWVDALRAYEQGRWSVGTGWTWGQTRPYWLCPHWRWVQQTSRSHVERRQTWTRIRQSTAQGRARTLQKPDQWANTRMCPLLLAAPWKTQTESVMLSNQNKINVSMMHGCMFHLLQPPLGQSLRGNELTAMALWKANSKAHSKDRNR